MLSHPSGSDENVTNYEEEVVVAAREICFEHVSRGLPSLIGHSSEIYSAHPDHPKEYFGYLRPPLKSAKTTDSAALHRFPLVTHYLRFDDSLPNSLSVLYPNLVSLWGTREDPTTTIRTAHPALLLVSCIEHIRHARNDDSIDPRSLTANRRNAQVFLLRHLVEAIVKTGNSDPQTSDAVHPASLESALPASRYTSLDEFERHIVQEWWSKDGKDHSFKAEKMAAAAAQWQVELEATESDVMTRYGKLRKSNLAAFQAVREWVNRHLKSPKNRKKLTIALVSSGQLARRSDEESPLVPSCLIAQAPHGGSARGQGSPTSRSRSRSRSHSRSPARSAAHSLVSFLVCISDAVMG
jgi:hypothetical protein